MARWKRPKPLAADVERALEGGADVVQAAREVLEWLDELEAELASGERGLPPAPPAFEKLRRYFRSAVEQWDDSALISDEPNRKGQQ